MAEQMKTATRFTSEPQQWCSKECRERQCDIRIALKRRSDLGRPFYCRARDMQPVLGCGGIQQITGIACLRHIRGRDHFLRPHKYPMLADLSPADVRHADVFTLGFEVQKSHERLGDSFTPNNMNTGFHQTSNSGSTGPS